MRVDSSRPHGNSMAGQQVAASAVPTTALTADNLRRKDIAADTSVRPVVKRARVTVVHYDQQHCASETDRSWPNEMEGMGTDYHAFQQIIEGAEQSMIDSFCGDPAQAEPELPPISSGILTSRIPSSHPFPSTKLRHTFRLGIDLSNPMDLPTFPGCPDWLKLIMYAEYQVLRPIQHPQSSARAPQPAFAPRPRPQSATCPPLELPYPSVPIPDLPRHDLPYYPGGRRRATQRPSSAPSSPASLTTSSPLFALPGSPP